MILHSRAGFLGVGECLDIWTGPAKQKVENWLSRNSWEILHYLLPQQKRYRSKGLIPYMRQKDRRGTHGGTADGETQLVFKRLHKQCGKSQRIWESVAEEKQLQLGVGVGGGGRRSTTAIPIARGEGIFHE